MKKEEAIKALLRKAEKSLEASKKLFSEGYYDFSISRAYYAMFYCAEALLFSKDLSFSKHSAVISAFGKEYIKTGIFPKKFQRYLSRAFEKRLNSDYEVGISLSKEDCEEVFKHAEEFLGETKKYLKIE
ncbi:HEPN domain-containing protein [Candidatus Aminicenantes bacterium AC-335-K20]|jgi:uncharacterized protein (UPF0332 family)|nr:HEPN domain-containing protein [SCandidatus Aminicenantes bacterium Aminicenantia_JdfR_composite]MCP2597218.1 HEPN domain-containing protein [Candidatus Aminicenantes bacterium AC-335-G13]MCP2598487.1 HEPN domain-containing protein [Candidatus Aminicenantes bacterium AC-335-L06]MCP2619527.1 HEPN domain-containing protein [Candidatus Aminicenantes bacterium AC-335-K20]MCP2621188.1 HEPN domain-containing protein [Candidatus Aminicenantes bacterium AC-334-E05]